MLCYYQARGIFRAGYMGGAFVKTSRKERGDGYIVSAEVLAFWGGMGPQDPSVYQAKCFKQLL